MRISLLLAVVLVGGCGVVTVGAACGDDAECVPGQSCFTAPPGGFCTRGCTEEGTTTECPQGTICTFMGGTLVACSPICTDGAQCRPAYECVEAGGTTARKSCRPPGARR